jgi:hypothetical protein
MTTISDAPMHAADRGDTATLPDTLASAARHLGAVEVAPSPAAPAELVADKGYQPVDEVVVQLRGSGSKVTAMAAV